MQYKAQRIIGLFNATITQEIRCAYEKKCLALRKNQIYTSFVSDILIYILSLPAQP